MPNSYVSNHVHIVFATKERAKLIPEDLQPRLWAYLAGTAKNHGMHAVAIGGIEDHVHALIRGERSPAGRHKSRAEGERE